MRKFLISMAGVASLVAVATPADAQFYPGRPAYDYGYGGYNNGYRSDRLIAINSDRIARIQYQIRVLAQRGMLSRGEAVRFERTAAEFRQQLAARSRNGMSGREGAMFDARLDRFEQSVRARAGYGYGYGYGNAYGYGYDRYGRW